MKRAPAATIELHLNFVSSSFCSSRVLEPLFIPVVGPVCPYLVSFMRIVSSIGPIDTLFICYLLVMQPLLVALLLFIGLLYLSVIHWYANYWQRSQQPIILPVAQLVANYKQSDYIYLFGCYYVLLFILVSIIPINNITIYRQAY